MRALACVSTGRSGLPGDRGYDADWIEPLPPREASAAVNRSRTKSSDFVELTISAVTDATALLVAQRLDWIEACGFARRIIAKKHANGGREQEAAGHCRQRNRRQPARRQ
jgi:hypothetical protein